MKLVVSEPIFIKNWILIIKIVYSPFPISPQIRNTIRISSYGWSFLFYVSFLKKMGELII